MSDAAAEETPAIQPSKTPIIIAAIAAVGLIGGGAFVALGSGSQKAESKAAAADDTEHAADDAGDDSGTPTAAGPVIKLEPFITNVTSDDGEMHYLKCSVALELRSAASQAAVEQRSARIRHEALLALRGLSVNVALDNEKRENIYKNILDRITEAAGKKHIARLYVTEFVVQ